MDSSFSPENGEDVAVETEGVVDAPQDASGAEVNAEGGARKIGRGGVALLAAALLAVIAASFLVTFAVRGGFDSSADDTSLQVEEFASLPTDPGTPATAPRATAHDTPKEHDGKCLAANFSR